MNYLFNEKRPSVQIVWLIWFILLFSQENYKLRMTSNFTFLQHLKTKQKHSIAKLFRLIDQCNNLLITKYKTKVLGQAYTWACPNLRYDIISHLWKVEVFWAKIFCNCQMIAFWATTNYLFAKAPGGDVSNVVSFALM